MKMHTGTFFAGAIFFLVGVALMLEALEVWELTFADLRYVVPLALVVAGLAVVVNAVTRRGR